MIIFREGGIKLVWIIRYLVLNGFHFYYIAHCVYDS